jgi:alpha/beta superfamily hydrolase
MPEVIFVGPAGRLEGRYHHSEKPRSPIALILHPHPQHGGTMNNKVVYNLYYSFVNKGFSVLRFNFRGVGRSQGEFDNGMGELSDSASALDWMQTINPSAPACWVAGFSFGAWIGMQLLMRRPEIEGFVSVAPPANMYDFTFLAPCPSSGIIVQGTDDDVVPEPSVEKFVNKLKMQKNISIDYSLVKGANHFFKDQLEQLGKVIEGYLGSRLENPGISRRKPSPAAAAAAAGQ